MQNLGVIWGLFSVVVIVAGATALHAVYTGSGPSYLGVSHYSQIESIPVAGQVLGPAFPGALGFLAPRFFSIGLIAAAFTTLISVSLTMTYFCLDMARKDWHFTTENTAVQGRLRGVDHDARAGRAVLAAAGAAQGDPRDGRQPAPRAGRGAGDHVLRQPAAASASSAPTPAAISCWASRRLFALVLVINGLRGLL